MWPFKKTDPQRYVMLVMFDDRIRIAKAFHTQSGWISRWVDNDDCWSILNPDGTTTGTNLVKKWYKHSGWPTEDNPEKEQYETQSDAASDPRVQCVLGCV